MTKCDAFAVLAYYLPLRHNHIGRTVKKMANSRIVVTTDGARLTVAPRGEIDHHSARSLRERIDSALYSARPEVLVLDLSHIDFMDSSGLGLLLGRYQRASEIGCEVRLMGCSARTKRILELAGADKLFKIEERA